jgi:hypothetical protein
MEYYAAIKNKPMSFAEKWIELEIMTNKVSQTQKDKCCVFSFICGIWGGGWVKE